MHSVGSCLSHSGYDAGVIPLAVVDWTDPVLAEIAMAASSVWVVSKANILRRINIRPELEAQLIVAENHDRVKQEVGVAA